MDLYKDEVFVFTPKGDLYKLTKGATVLDFAFHIHTNVGSRCIGGRVNGKNVPIRQVLNSGDQVEILTSSTQTPKNAWLNIVTTSRARTKIRQALKEITARQSDFAREMLDRKFKNRKLEYDEAIMMRLIKKEGFKEVSEFYQKIAEESLDVNEVIDKYLAMQKRENSESSEPVSRSAENYNLQEDEETIKQSNSSDVLVIGKDVKGIDFSLAKCCNPIYGDDVFGFVTINGGIKIHRTDCPNAPQMKARFGYRMVPARWAGKGKDTQYSCRLSVIGHDDIGIVNNITSIISKEPNIQLRSISISSNDGLFSGMLTVNVDDTSKLEALLKKLRGVKGVKQVVRS
jgi:GTP pyrophosphokinase